PTSTPVSRPTSTALASSTGGSSVFGQSVTFTANISSSFAGTPSGTVAFKENGTTITGCGSQAITSGQATCATSALAVSGTAHAITADYSGDSAFDASTGTLAGGQTVSKASTSLGLTSNDNPALGGDSITFTATISVTAPGGGTPTGTVNFKD